MSWGKIEKWEWEEKYKKDGGYTMSVGNISISNGKYKSDCPRCAGSGKYHVEGNGPLGMCCNCYTQEGDDWERTKKKWEHEKSHIESQIKMPIMTEKPPRGVIPEYYYERDRILDLARAISDYVEHNRSGEHLLKWCDELRERIEKWNKMENKL